MNGIHKITREEYAAAPGVNNTQLSWAWKSLAHFAHYLQNPPEQTDAMADGILIHQAVLEPDVFAAAVIAIPDDAPRRPTAMQLNAKKPSPETIEAIEWWESFNSRATGRTILSPGKLQWIEDMAAAVLADPFAAEILDACTCREFAVFSRHGSTGLLLKSCMDAMTDGYGRIFDLKTTTNAEPEAYRRTVQDRGYHRAGAFYVDHFPRLGLGLTRPQFGHIVVEKEPPYVVSVRMFDEDSLQIGRLEYGALLHKIANSQQSGHFPGYDDGVGDTGLTFWKLKEVLR